MKTVLITGVTGQDGANMAEYLLENTDYKVVGMIRRSSNINYVNCKKIKDNKRFTFEYGDLSDSQSINQLVSKVMPDYFINFAANSYVGCSWQMPEQIFDVNTIGVLRCLEAIKNIKPSCKFYSAGSSEEWGNVDYSPQDLKHPLKPRSPYGASKASARHIVKVYRESYNIFAIHSILFNHEGTKRGPEFVTRKITKNVSRIHHAINNKQPFQPLELGNLDSKRDWSDSEDFVKGVWQMLNQEEPNDYILSSDETHSIREFVEKAFREAGIEGVWHGKGLSEEYCLPNYIMEECEAKSSVLVKINEKFYRPAEVELLLGDSSLVREKLGWKPEISFDKLVSKMVKFDIDNYEN
jgi:GDPmannose 4,6-dehydratase